MIDCILFCFFPLYVAWNHGIALLSALCKEAGIETELLLLGHPCDFKSRIADYEGRYIGFSAVCSEDYKRCVPFMRMAKDAGKTVLLGGVWAGLDKPVDESVDYVCRGDGESLPDFLLSGDDFLFTAKAYRMALDLLPLPDYEMFKDIPFERGIPFLGGKKVLPYVSSRGCWGECTFCQVRYQTPGTVRIRRKVAEDLTFLRDKYQPDVFYINDASLPYPCKKWRDSWQDFRHPFVCYIRADIEPEVLDWLIDRGLIGCAFGIESGDEAFRNDVLQKGLTDEQLFRTVEMLHKRGVEYVPFFMTDIPGETFLIKTKTAKMAKEIGGYPVIWKYERLKGD